MPSRMFRVNPFVKALERHQLPECVPEYTLDIQFFGLNYELLDYHFGIFALRSIRNMDVQQDTGRAPELLQSTLKRTAENTDLRPN